MWGNTSNTWWTFILHVGTQTSRKLCWLSCTCSRLTFFLWTFIRLAKEEEEEGSRLSIWRVGTKGAVHYTLSNISLSFLWCWTKWNGWWVGEAENWWDLNAWHWVEEAGRWDGVEVRELIHWWWWGWSCEHHEWWQIRRQKGAIGLVGPALQCSLSLSPFCLLFSARQWMVKRYWHVHPFEFVLVVDHYCFPYCFFPKIMIKECGGYVWIIMSCHELAKKLFFVYKVNIIYNVKLSINRTSDSFLVITMVQVFMTYIYLL